MTHGERVLIAADGWLSRKKRPCPVKYLCHATELHKDKVKVLLVSLADQGRCTLGIGKRGTMAVVELAHTAHQTAQDEDKS